MMYRGHFKNADSASFKRSNLNNYRQRFNNKNSANKDKKKLWLGLMQSFRAGEKAEAVAGLMAWKARQMRDAKLSRELVALYHDSHRGAGDLELLLERFALKL